MAMQRIEEYQEIVERDSIDISYLWKGVQIFLYFLCAASGYICSIVFYMLWEDVFDGNCPLWATLEFLPTISGRDDPLEQDFDDPLPPPRVDDWRQYVIVNYEYEYRCKIYWFTCLTSSAFGIIWLVLFSICGKGGYDIGIYDSPWRIVVPSLTFNVILAILTSYATSDMERGYEVFATEVRTLLSMSNVHQRSENRVRRCETLKQYLEIYNPHRHDPCHLLVVLQMSSWVMMWSWIGNLIVLAFRIITFVDFRLVYVRIYSISQVIIPFSSQESDEKQKVQ